MVKNLLKSLLVLILAFSVSNAFGQVIFTGEAPLEVMFFVGDSASAVDGDPSTMPGDSKIVDELTLDENINLAAVKTSASVTEADKDAYDVIIISATISSGDAAPLMDPSAGLVIWEAYAFKPTALAILVNGTYHNYHPMADPGDPEIPNLPYEQLNIVSDTFALNAGLEMGEQYVFDDVVIAGGDAAEWYDLYSVKDSTKGFVVAMHLDNEFVNDDGSPETINGDSAVAIWGIEKGQQIAATASPDGVARAATSNAVGLWLHDQTPDVLSTEGLDLFRASVYWAGEALKTNVGIGQLFHREQLKVYPNPATDHIYVTLPEGMFDVTLYNMTGQEVRNVSQVHGNASISLSGLDTGVYIMKASDGDNVSTMKILKR